MSLVLTVFCNLSGIWYVFCSSLITRWQSILLLFFTIRKFCLTSGWKIFIQNIWNHNEKLQGLDYKWIIYNGQYYQIVLHYLCLYLTREHDSIGYDCFVWASVYSKFYQFIWASENSSKSKVKRRRKKIKFFSFRAPLHWSVQILLPMTVVKF